MVTLSLSKGFAQNIDSLKLALKNAKHDTTRINILSELSEICEVEDILLYAEPCAKLCEKAILVNIKPKVWVYRYRKAIALNVYSKKLLGYFINLGLKIGSKSNFQPQRL